MNTVAAEVNFELSRDFLRAVRARRRTHPAFDRVLRSASSVLEVNCDAGYLSAMIQRAYHPRVLYATDPDEDRARAAQRAHPKVRYEPLNLLRDWPTPISGFELGVCLNLPEHKSDCSLLSKRLLALTERTILARPGYHVGLGDPILPFFHGGELWTAVLL